MCRMQLVGLSSDWPTGGVSRRDAVVPVWVPEWDPVVEKPCWEANPQRQPCAAILSTLGTAWRTEYLKAGEKTFEELG